MTRSTDRLSTIGDVDVEDQRVLLRVDFDVPLLRASDGTPAQVADDTRIRTALVTIDELRRRGACLVLVSHLGHPKGPDPAWSLRPVADRLAKLTGAPVALAPRVVGSDVRVLTERLLPGEMLMLENVRFEPGETQNDPQLAAALAELGDLYVDDAFACADRAHASVEGIAHLLPCAAGRVMEREISALSAVVAEPSRPLVAVFGGANLDDKIGVIRRFLQVADAVCIGGAICFPFLAAVGNDVGGARCAYDELASARATILAAGRSGRLELPRDLMLARCGEERAVPRALDGVHVPEDWTALDIGTGTARRFASEVAAAATVFWSGPMGRSELGGFANGTREIADAVASTSATSVVGGRHTAQALRSYGLQERVSYVSTGGRATLGFLEGRQLPGIQALLRKAISAT